jgi:hypothetical protein
MGKNEVENEEVVKTLKEGMPSCGEIRIQRQTRST